MDYWYRGIYYAKILGGGGGMAALEKIMCRDKLEKGGKEKWVGWSECTKCTPV